MLDVWPTLPVIVQEWNLHTNNLSSMENVIAALGNRDRVYEITLRLFPLSFLDMFTAMTQEPFLALTDLRLEAEVEPAMILPESFLGGFAPRLQSLKLYGIPFPGLSNLLFSTNDLVDLRLFDIPHSGYITPDAMVTCLSSLTRLQEFHLRFNSTLSCPNRPTWRPPSLPRVDLPFLTQLNLDGMNEYIEDLVARINTPLLFNIWITLFNALFFDVSQLAQFVGGIENLRTPHQASVNFFPTIAYVRLSEFESSISDATLELKISSTQSEWQLSSLAEICSTPSSPIRLSSLDRLNVSDEFAPPGHWHDDMENTQWVELLQPFTTVKDLYLSEKVALPIARALQELAGERATEVLPALQSIHIRGYQPSGAIQEAVGPFITTRQLSSRPVVVQPWV
jgi:hypothetical protein